MTTDTPQTVPPTSRSPLLRQPALLVAGIAVALALGQWLNSSRRIDALQTELAQRLSAGDEIARTSRTTSQQNREEVQALIARIGVLEAQINEAQGQQAALETMYQELARGRDERLLAEIEQAVAIAAQQLQLAGNVEAALIALQGADARLNRSGNTQLPTVHRLLVRDIERLKALPQADISGMAVKLEGVVAVVDSLPLAYTQRPPKQAVVAANAERPAMTDSAYWGLLASDLWQEVRQLVRVERMDQDAPALLAPSQALFLRENLRLRLVNARLSLLQRDAKSFRDDVQLAMKWLNLYFDMRSPAVKVAHDNLQRMAAANLNLALPSLDETLTALRNVRLPREKK